MATFPARRVPLRSGGAVVIRSALPGDAAAVLALLTAMLEERSHSVLLPEELPRDVAFQRAQIEEALGAANRLCLVAEGRPGLAGVIDFSCRPERRAAHAGTFSLTVGRGFRRHGIGARLIACLLHWARAAPGVEKVCLSVLPTNGPAIRLYERLGFLREGCCPRAAKLGPRGYADEVLMYRFVKPSICQG